MRSCQNDSPHPHLLSSFLLHSQPVESSLSKCFSLAWLSDELCLFISFVMGCVSTEKQTSVVWEQACKDLIYIHITPTPPLPPIPPPLLECWLFYQHPNVEFWSNSMCVPNIAPGHCGDVFMTKTLISKSSRMRGMVCISCTFLTGHSSLLLAPKLRLASL